MRTTVHLLRHGEVHNPEKVLYGRLPGYVLSDLGHEMAKRASVALADRDVAAVISSPLERAQQTATPVAQVHKLDILLDDNLIEAENVLKDSGYQLAMEYFGSREPGNIFTIR